MANCKICANEFDKKTEKQRFCSLPCYHISLRMPESLKSRTCIQCKKSFISTQKSKKQVLLNKFCSKQCKSIYRSKTQRTGEYKVCLYCNKQFYTKPCHKDYKCCSITCANKFRIGKYNPNSSISRAKLVAEGKINPKRNFYKQGWYIRKNGDKEWFGSSYEEIRMKQLDGMGIMWTKNHKIVIPYLDGMGNRRNYVPDFLIDGRIIEEVKPKAVIDSNFNNCKIKIPYALEFCKANGYEYRIVTEGELKISRKSSCNLLECEL